MLDLLLTILPIAVVVWLRWRWRRDAYAAGERAGYAQAERNAIRRQERKELNNE